MSIRKRKTPPGSSTPRKDQKTKSGAETSGSMSSFLRRQPVWIILAVSSGSCAAINGVFAKLTTTALTSDLASRIATALDLSADNKYVNLALRGSFFGLNILFNIAMWALFTAALTRSNSTTRVSIVNVSSNFFITAMLGWMIFGEKLPPLWWLGAALLAAGNVVIGRREEGEKPGGTVGLDETREEAEGLLSRDIPDLLGDDTELETTKPSSSAKRANEEERRMKVGEAADDPI